MVICLFFSFVPYILCTGQHENPHQKALVILKIICEIIFNYDFYYKVSHHSNVKLTES